MAALTDHSPTSNLCHLCNEQLEQALRCGEALKNQGLKSLKKSAQDGCPTCNWLWNRVPAFSLLKEIPPAAPAPDTGDRIELFRRWTATPGESGAPGATWFKLDLWSSMDHNNWTALGLNEPVGYLLPQYHAVLARPKTKILSTSYRPPVNTGANETLRLAGQWMHKCISSHISCGDYRRPDWAPTRLLKVSPRDDGKISAKLEERAEGHYSNTVEYLALSHRWLADNENPLLTKENVSQFRDNIEIASLKASIRDAIFAAVRLGMYYLWVDTLCILADDNDDRLAEIGMMDSVYSNALCTIAAGVGKTAEEGCFTSRDVNEVRTHGVHVKWSVDESLYYLLRLSSDDTNQELDNTSLARRGWTFQERFLSPRTLHFCAQQVHWECRELKANETHPERSLTRPNWHSSMGFADMATPWTKIIEAYTIRSLTLQTDRLHAIKGVANFLHRKLNAEGQSDEYLHGLWRSSLPHSLVWGPKDLPKHERLNKVAPTWSWASTNEEIHFIYSKVHDVDKALVDISGIVNGSDIPSTDASCKTGFENGIIRIRGQLYRSSKYQIPYYLSFRPRIRYDYKEAEQSDSEPTQTYLAIFKTKPSELEGYRVETLWGIVLRALGGGSSKVYERVGSYQHTCRIGGGDAPFGEEQDIYLC